MKKLLILLLVLIPLSASAQFTVPQGGTGKNAFPLGGFIYADSALRFHASSSPTFGWLTATSTATSSFFGGIQTRYLNTISTTASSTFANGVNLTGGCFSINGVCVGTGSGSGTVTSVAMSVPSLLSVSGSPITTSGTLAVSYSGTPLPVANGGTASTTNLGGILAGNGASAIKSVIIGTGLTFDGSTLTATGGSSASTTLLSDTNTFSTTATTTFNAGIKGGLLNIISTTASSTFANGLNLTGGCFSINGTCITGGGGSSSGASTTLLADVNTFSTTATTTFSGKVDANRITSLTSRVTGLVSCDTIDSDAYGNLLCGSDSTGAGGSVTGNGIAGMMSAWSSASNLIATSTIIGERFVATSTTATSTFAGNIQAKYGLFGTAVPLSTDATVLMEAWGDSNAGVVMGIGNRNAGNAAYNCLFLNNDLTDPTVTHYGALCLNSSTYNDTTYGTLLSDPNQLSIEVTDGPLTFISSKATGYVSFGVGGKNAANEAMRIIANENVGIGTTSPYAKLSVVGQVVSEFFTATSTSATSTFWGGFVANNGRIISDRQTGSTTVSQMYLGNINFEDNAGVVNLANMDLTAGATLNTPEGIAIAFNDMASTSIRINGLSNGAGQLNQFGFRIATSTAFDVRDKLTVGAALGLSATSTITLETQCTNVRNSSGTWVSFYFIGTTMVTENNLCR